MVASPEIVFTYLTTGKRVTLPIAVWTPFPRKGDYVALPTEPDALLVESVTFLYAADGGVAIYVNLHDD